MRTLFDRVDANQVGAASVESSRAVSAVQARAVSAVLASAVSEKIFGEVCAICGALAPFGFGVFLRQDKPGRWACATHRDDVERMG